MKKRYWCRRYKALGRLEAVSAPTMMQAAAWYGYERLGHLDPYALAREGVVVSEHRRGEGGDARREVVFHCLTGYANFWTPVEEGCRVGDVPRAAARVELPLPEGLDLSGPMDHPW